MKVVEVGLLSLCIVAGASMACDVHGAECLYSTFSRSDDQIRLSTDHLDPSQRSNLSPDARV